MTLLGFITLLFIAILFIGVPFLDMDEFNGPSFISVIFGISMFFTVFFNYTKNTDYTNNVNKQKITVVTDDIGYLIRYKGKTIIEGMEIEKYNKIKKNEFELNRYVNYNYLNQPTSVEYIVTFK